MKNEIRQHTDWLKDLADDASLWEERAYEEMPAVIAHEYKRLHELAKDGNVYGTMLQMKDVYEIILKYPCVLALCIFRCTKDSAGAEAFDALMSEILGKLLSFGDWRDRIARTLKKCNEYLPAQLVLILGKSYSLTTEQFVGKSTGSGKGKDIVNWRNDAIGHGALRLEEDEELRREIRSMLEKLQAYFGAGSKISIRGQYDNIVLMQGERALVGWRAADLTDNETPFSLVIKNNEAFPASFEDLKYILPYEGKICFFDAYMKYKKKSKYLDYVAGHLNLRPRDFFYELYEKLVRDEKHKTMQEFSEKVTDTETEILLAELSKAYHFQKPDYILAWMEAKIRRDGKGCYMLRMGRGMGKSAFSAYLDGRYSKANEPQPIQAECLVRTYHCSRNRIRGFNDFVTSLNSMFLEADHLDGLIQDIEGIFENMQRGETGSTAKALNSRARYFRQRQGKDIVLVIDGLDEIVDYDMFNYFPNPSDLENGVFIFYTARPDEELPPELRERIGQIDVQETYSVTDADKSYREVVLNYAKEEMKQSSRRSKAPEAYRKLVETADYNFLKLRLLLPVYCSGMDIDALGSETDMFARYLGLLGEQYGEKFFAIYGNPLLVIFAIFSDGLTFDELSKLMDNMDNPLMLLAALNDLKGVLSVERSDRGNIYKLANEEYVRYVKEEYKSSVFSYKKEYADNLSVMVEKIQDTFDWVRIRDTNGLVRFDRPIRNYIKELFPAVFVLRENLFQIIGPSHSFNTIGFGIFANEVEMVDFMEKFLLLNKCVGYTYAEMNRSVEIFDWMQQYLIDLACDAIGRKKIYDIGEKLAVCFSYLYQIMSPFPRDNDIYRFWEIAENFYKVLDEISIFNNSYQLFKLRYYLGRTGNYFKFNGNYMERVIEKKEFHLFVEHEKEVFSSLFTHDIEEVDSVLSRIPHTEKERAWVNNLLLNKYMNDSYGLPDYSRMKKAYDAIIAGDCVPAYFEHGASKDDVEKETEKFTTVITALSENDRNKYRELSSGTSLYDLDWKRLCEELAINSLERYEEAVYYFLEGCKRKKEELERFIEEEVVIDEIMSYNDVISFYYAVAFPDTTVDVNHIEDSKEFFTWLTRTYSFETINDYLKRSRASERVANILSYRYRRGRKEDIEQVKRWLDTYQEIYSILDSDQYCWVYFSEFENYFNYMIDTDREKLYLDLKNNKIWVKIWKQITPNYEQYKEEGDKRFALAQSLIYLVFTIKYAMEKGEFLIAKRFASQFIKDILKYEYYDLGERLFAWVECQKVLRKTNAASVDCYEMIRQIEKRLELIKNNHECGTKYYTDMLALCLNECVCAFMYGDYQKIPALEREIERLVVEAKKEETKTHWKYIDESEVKSASLQIMLMNLIYKYVSGEILSGQFAIRAKEIIPNLRERYDLDSDLYFPGYELYLETGTRGSEALCFSMFSCLCKKIFSNEEYSRLCSKFDELIVGYEFSLSDEGFSLHFSYNRSDWFLMV